MTAPEKDDGTRGELRAITYLLTALLMLAILAGGIWALNARTSANKADADRYVEDVIAGYYDEEDE